MPRIPISSEKEHSGTEESSVFAVSESASRFHLTMTRTDTWPVRAGEPPESEIMMAWVLLSQDGGGTYTSGGGVGAPGGDIISSKDAKSTQTTLSGVLQGVGNPNRVIKVKIDAKNAFTSKIDLDIT